MLLFPTRPLAVFSLHSKNYIQQILLLNHTFYFLLPGQNNRSNKQPNNAASPLNSFFHPFFSTFFHLIFNNAPYIQKLRNIPSACIYIYIFSVLFVHTICYTCTSTISPEPGSSSSYSIFPQVFFSSPSNFHSIHRTKYKCSHLSLSVSLLLHLYLFMNG